MHWQSIFEGGTGYQKGEEEKEQGYALYGLHLAGYKRMIARALLAREETIKGTCSKNTSHYTPGEIKKRRKRDGKDQV